MKQISILFFFSFFAFYIHAQDTISLKNGVIVNGSILEKNRSSIKYKSNDQTSEDTIGCTKLSKVSTIHYGTGKVDLLSSQNPRSIFPLGVNSGFLVGADMAMFLGSIDYLIIPNISAEISLKWVPFTYYNRYFYSIGGKYWFANKYSENGLSPFVGLFFTQLMSRNDEDRILGLHEPVWLFRNLPEIPIGISYINKSGFQTSLQLNCLLGFWNSDLSELTSFIEFRVGWRFKTSKKGY
jgi:hypothetical protein